MKAKKERNHNRAAGQTTMNVSLPEDIKAYFTQKAKTEHRSLSNFLTVWHEQIMFSQQVKEKVATPPTHVQPVQDRSDFPAVRCKAKKLNAS